MSNNNIQYHNKDAKTNAGTSTLLGKIINTTRYS